MNKNFYILLLILLSAYVNAASKDVCLLTDMSLDVDDIGALQVALYYHHINEINLRCIISGTSNSQNHRSIKYIADWWGYDEIRIGTNKSGNGGSFEHDHEWVNAFNSKYKIPSFVPEDGAALLNRMLDVHGSDLIVIEVGPATTIYNARARGRINKYYQMGGRYPSGREYNMVQFVQGAAYAAGSGYTQWYDYKLGLAVITGQSSVFTKSTPIKFAYDTFTKGAGRYSWDLLTVLGAIDSSWFNYRVGVYNVSSNGSGVWSGSSTRHRMAYHNNQSTVKQWLNYILKLTPNDVASKRGANIVPIVQLLLLD